MDKFPKVCISNQLDYPRKIDRLMQILFLEKGTVQCTAMEPIHSPGIKNVAQDNHRQKRAFHVGENDKGCIR